MKEKHKLDELFRKELEQHTTPVPSGVFESVMRKRNGGVIPLLFGGNSIWLLAIGVLLVAGGAFLSGVDAVADHVDIPGLGDGKVADHATGIVSEGPQDQMEGTAEYISNDNQHKSEGSGTEGQLRQTASITADVPEVGMAEGNTENSLPKAAQVEEDRQLGVGVDSSPVRAHKPEMPKSSTARQFHQENTTPGDLGKANNPSGSPAAELKQDGGERNASSHAAELSGSTIGATVHDSAQPASEYTIKDPGNQNRLSNQEHSGSMSWAQDNKPVGDIDGAAESGRHPSLLDVQLRPTLQVGSEISTGKVIAAPKAVVHGPREKRWFLDAVGGYQKNNSAWSSGSRSDLRTEMEEFKGSSSVLGLRSGVQLAKNLELSLAATFTKYRSEVLTESTRVESFPLVTSTDSTYFDQNLGVWVTQTYYDTTLVDSLYVVRKTHNNSYQTMTLPISVGYVFDRGRIAFGVHAGLSFDLLLSHYGKYPVLVEDSTFLSESYDIALSDGDPSIRSGLSFFGGVSARYRITDRISLLLEGTYRSGTLPFNKGGAAYWRPNRFGLGGALRYYF